MMRFNVVLSMILAAPLLVGAGPCATARAQASEQRSDAARRLSGVITAIDRRARTLSIREMATGREVVVVFNNGLGVRLRDGYLTTFPRTIPFEMALVGMVVDLTVSSASHSLPR